MRVRRAQGLSGVLRTTLEAHRKPAAASGPADNFNGDGYRDLATGAPGAGAGGKAKAGAAVVNYGSSSGISAGRTRCPGTPRRACRAPERGPDGPGSAVTCRAGPPATHGGWRGRVRA
ncbi:hypothetical protein [Streptomyces luteolus]|uniref:hypothetical protein n=1 Tax=Streptomyces luteolus TaxID=3043615 RepID=UPI0038D1E42B